MTKNPIRMPQPTRGMNPQQVKIQIRCRAFELYEARGREDGHDLEDWLRAEEEMMRPTMTKPARA